jgi:D-glycero-alpha-D-manno-heptose-7-phosphate kinase
MIRSNIKRIIYNSDDKISKVLKTFGLYAQITNNRPFALLINKNNQCIATITDGDIRRYLSKGGKVDDPIIFPGNKKFHYLDKNSTLNKKIREFEKLFSMQSGIYTLPVLNKDKKIAKIINYHDISENYKSSEIVVKKKQSGVVVSVPTRISFVGGGYDFSNYINLKENYILTTTLNKRVFVSASLRKDKHIYINNLSANKKFKISSKKTIKKDLISLVLKSAKIDYGVNLEIDSEFTQGSGLGGSSALTIALISALKLLKDKNLNFYKIANEAYRIERIEFGNYGGWQDYFATLFGGFKWLKMNNTDINFDYINLDENIKSQLNYEMLSFKFGNIRSSSFIQKFNLKNKNLQKNLLKYSDISLKIATEMKKNLINGNLDDFYKLIDKSWHLKKKINQGVSTKQIDKIYQTAIKNGAVGGKLLGAGKSGYFVFFSRRKFHKKITVSLKKLNLKLENLRIENEGIKFWRKF